MQEECKTNKGAFKVVVFEYYYDCLKFSSACYLWFFCMEECKMNVKQIKEHLK